MQKDTIYNIAALATVACVVLLYYYNKKEFAITPKIVNYTLAIGGLLSAYVAHTVNQPDFCK